MKKGKQRKASGSGARVMGAYSRFLKTELMRLRDEFPAMEHRERYQIAAKRWRHGERAATTDVARAPPTARPSRTEAEAARQS